MVELPPIERLQAVKLEPGDVLMAQVQDNTTAEQAVTIKARLQAAFPDNDVFIYQGIMFDVHRTVALEEQPPKPHTLAETLALAKSTMADLNRAAGCLTQLRSCSTGLRSTLLDMRRPRSLAQLASSARRAIGNTNLPVN